ncbi:MAG: hypothetical protein IJT06_00195 [Selenomonadaceae bacterium]|nr:hypothetical protein [Selenomonadaceae bacterium]
MARIWISESLTVSRQIVIIMFRNFWRKEIFMAHEYCKIVPKSNSRGERNFGRSNYNGQ